MLDLAWLIPAAPLTGFIINMLVGKRLGEPMAGWVATIAAFLSFVFTVLVFFDLRSLEAADRFHIVDIFTWISAGSFEVNAGLLIDPLSVTMVLFITGVGTLIHLYSIGYMHGDENFSKFFIYLNMFVFSMLLLVLGDNLLLTFLGWEGVGACSYLLISFWFTEPQNASAGKKAFVTNRVGDFGYMLATFLVFWSLGSINYDDIAAGAIAGDIATVTASAIVLLFLLAATGKSAQIPLFVWLPDAMAGPTPVSALIHAATMVTSGVFLLTRLNPILAEASPWVLDVIAWTGAITALVAATAAVAQNDIKRVLAYSTISQLGYLFLAVGVGGYVPAIFHMITHAFFKALLFLGSGSVIHGVHDEQDMRFMGGLKKFMPVTSFTFIIGWLAIAGVPPFSGFWSKDEILVFAWGSNKALWVVGLVTALLTGFYMTRQVILTFFGKPRFDVEKVKPHESPKTMTIPLVVLSVLAAVAGGLNLPFTKDFLGGTDVHFLEGWLEPSLFANEAKFGTTGSTKVWLALVAIAAGAVAIFAAYKLFGKGGSLSPEDVSQEEIEASPLRSPFLENAWFIDATYAKFMGGPGQKMFEFFSYFDRTAVDGISKGVAGSSAGVGTLFRKAQTGYVRNYVALIALGAIAMCGWVVWSLVS